MNMLAMGVACLLTVAASWAGQSKAVVRGTVADLHGAVIVSATVMLFSELAVIETKTDAEGKFEFRELADGSYELEVTSPGFRRAQIDRLSVAETGPKPLTIMLEIASSHENCGSPPRASYEKASEGAYGVVGSVSSADFEPLALTADLYVTKAGDDRVIAKSSASPKGEFAFEKLEPGRYIVRAKLKGYGEASTQAFRVARNNLTRLRILLFKEGSMIVC